MFTGIIQSLGNIQRIGTDKVRIVWGGATPPGVTADLALGDSVAVDGICLTVSQILTNGFVADASPETLNRTTLGQLESGNAVNIETSLRVGSKLGGHFVTGHIDGVGYLQSTVQTANAWEMRICVADSRVSCYIVSKGSIAVNGVSLTVADCDSAGSWFKAAVIPVTYAETNLQYLKAGDRINLEGDLLGKYVQKFLNLSPSSDGVRIDQPDESLARLDHDFITPSFLSEHGYL
ncbi:MAG: riboflavin synthase [Elainellaceae cyanobacterium]